MRKKIKEFNIVIVGTGGQGLITLLEIIAEAALLEGFDVKTSELHGLAQRGGSVEVHITFGKKVLSPLVNQGEANLIIALEAQEALKACYYACPVGPAEAGSFGGSKKAKTVFLINDFFVPIPNIKPKSSNQILKELKRFSQKTILVPASDICQKELGSNVVAGIYLLSLAVFQKLLPLKPNSILKIIQEKIPEKYLELNLKTFELARCQ